MICPRCKAENADGSEVCATCGQQLIEARIAWQPEGGSVQSLPLNRTLSIGRVAGNDIVIPDNAMSRQHARIEVTPDGTVLVDLGSLNGTFLNGERIAEEKYLADGDVVRVGRTLITVSLEAVRVAEEPENEATVAIGDAAAAIAAMEQQSADEQEGAATVLVQTDFEAANEGAATLLMQPDLGSAEGEAAPVGMELEGAGADDSGEAGATMLMPTEAAEEPSGSQDLPFEEEQDGSSDKTVIAEAPIFEPDFEEEEQELKEEPVPTAPAIVGYLVAGDVRAPLISTISIGRAEGNDIRIENDRLVSRNHARIEARPDGVWLEDLQSANGTFHNDTRVTAPVRVSDGDDIRFGATGYRFESALVAAQPSRPVVEESPSGATEIFTGTGVTPTGTDVMPAVSEEYDSGATIISEGLGEPEPVGSATAPEPSSGSLADQYHLIVNFGPETGRSFPLQDETVIGRAAPEADYDIQLNDRAVSRPHAKIVREDDRYTIHDLDSANGTWVNYTEEISAPRKLSDGDVIKVGKTTLVYRVPAAIRPAASDIMLDPTAGQILTVFSLKGGVGTTTIAVNLAVCFRQLAQQSVLVVDLSTERGAVGVHMNLTPKLTLADLPQDPSSIDWDAIQTLLVHHPSGVDILPAPPSPQTAELVTAAAVSAILPAARARYKWVIVDTSPTFSELNLGVFDQSDLILLPLAPDMTSVKVMQSTLDVFAALQTPGDRRVLILNQTHPRSHIGQPDIEQHLGERIGLVLPYAEDAILDSIDNGVPLASSSPAQPTMAAIQGFAGKLAQVKIEAADQPAKRGGFGQWVQGLIGRRH